MKKLTIMIIILVAVTLASISLANSVDGWESNLTVTVMNADNRLSFGQQADATDGMDGQYEVPAMLSGDIRAYFICNGAKIWRDIQAVGQNPKVWDLVIETSYTGKDVELRWNAASLPEGTTLLDITAGRSIDMNTYASYSYQHNGTRKFKIEVTGGI
jgi:hypothetical protein